ncbi:MAG: F0F1 ATP synthase subunit gamma [Gammaproteobacteria bacterium]|jgi:F-type H+-transporting ATPase subunit gamma|nr:F0F1 ATP synthase subunit gamma [Gammaproteobacteria bacterium]
MPNLDTLKRSIETVQDIQSIVRTMKALAAVSIYPYERAIESMHNYSRTIELGLQVLFADRVPMAEARNRQQADVGIVVFGSDRGLCGRFNEDITEFTLATLENKKIAIDRRHVLAVGARVEARLREAGQSVHESFFVPGSVAGITATVQAILQQIESWQKQHTVAKVLLFYNRQLSGKGRRAELSQLLPLEFTQFQGSNAPAWPSRSIPTYTMERADLFASLVRQYLFIWVFRACAFSLASENAGRLASMQAAERNISERLLELSRNFSQQRQETITSELLEVVSGFMVLVDVDQMH